MALPIPPLSWAAPFRTGVAHPRIRGLEQLMRQTIAYVLIGLLALGVLFAINAIRRRSGRDLYRPSKRKRR